MRGRNKFRTIRGGKRSDPLRFWPEARRKPAWRRYLPLWGGAVAIGTLVGAGWDKLPTRSASDPQAILSGQGVRASFGYCYTGGGYNCVVDGDTIWLKGQKIRIADIDAPETHEPRCLSEKALGDRATQKLHQLMNSGTVTLERIDRDHDRYGRLLRIVRVDGVSVGETLIDEGFARRYAGGRRPWC